METVIRWVIISVPNGVNLKTNFDSSKTLQKTSSACARAAADDTTGVHQLDYVN